jgi:hypothetical protein
VWQQEYDEEYMTEAEGGEEWNDLVETVQEALEVWWETSDTATLVQEYCEE